MRRPFRRSRTGLRRDRQDRRERRDLQLVDVVIEVKLQPIDRAQIAPAGARMSTRFARRMLVGTRVIVTRMIVVFGDGVVVLVMIAI